MHKDLLLLFIIAVIGVPQPGCGDDGAGTDPVCGDGIVNGDEVCDGVVLAGRTCETEGFASGTLACNATCDGLDTAGCHRCGDDVAEGPELCDGPQLGGEDCVTQGFTGGTLLCDADCAGFDTSGCHLCGDDVLEGPELCDGSQLGGEDCSSVAGLNAGELGCHPDCTFDTTGCYDCQARCNADGSALLDCHDDVLQACAGADVCNPQSLACEPGCQVAADNGWSTGCEFHAVDMASQQPGYCFAVVVVNASATAAFLEVEYAGQVLDADASIGIALGSGPSPFLLPYDALTGLSPGESAVVFLSGTEGGSPNCGLPPVVPGNAGVQGTSLGLAFRLTTNVPVAAFQVNPYGGAGAGIAEGSLLLPTASWGTNYVLVSAYEADLVGPSVNIIAAEDDTTVTLRPVAAIAGGGGVPASPANTPLVMTLQAGQQIQIEQTAELTGSVLQADKPVGVMAGHGCMRVPVGTAYCDHGEEMIPPISALGHEYVGVMHRPRSGEPGIWRLVGVVDNTALTWSTNVGGPSALDEGEVVELVTETPFVVASQDADHPFLLLGYMSSSQWSQLSDPSGYGDPSVVVMVPPAQYGRRAVFHALYGFPESNVVVVRAPEDGAFHDVTLGCAGVLTGWQPVGGYEWTRVDLGTGDFLNVGSCTPGPQVLQSDGPFGAYVWGWGTPLTSTFTANTSYAYPASMGLSPINSVTIQP